MYQGQDFLSFHSILYAHLVCLAFKVYFVKDINAGSVTEEENTTDEVKTFTVPLKDFWFYLVICWNFKKYILSSSL